MPLYHRLVLRASDYSRPVRRRASWRQSRLLPRGILPRRASRPEARTGRDGFGISLIPAACIEQRGSPTPVGGVRTLLRCATSWPPTDSGRATGCSWQQTGRYPPVPLLVKGYLDLAQLCPCKLSSERASAIADPPENWCPTSISCLHAQQIPAIGHIPGGGPLEEQVQPLPRLPLPRPLRAILFCG